MNLDYFRKISSGLRGLLFAASFAAGGGAVTWLAIDISSQPFDLQTPATSAETPRTAGSYTPVESFHSDQRHPAIVAATGEIMTPRVSPIYRSDSSNAAGTPYRRANAVPAAQPASSPAAAARTALSLPDDGFVSLMPRPITQPQALAGPLVVEVTPGVRTPAVLLPSNESLSPEEAKIQEHLAGEFAKKLGDRAGPDKEVAPPVYEAIVAETDSSYRKFFGDVPYNHKTMESALAALEAARSGERR